MPRPLADGFHGRMTRTVRIITAISVAAFALLSFGFVVLQPDLPDDRADWLAAFAAAPARAGAAAHLFLWSQLALAVAAVGLGAWLRPRAPRLAVAGAVLGVLGAFAHTIPGGWTITQLVMAGEPANHDTYAQLLVAQEQSSHMAPYFLLGVAGLVLGILLLSIAHFCSRLPFRWAGPVLWAWLVVEFVGTSFGSWAVPTSGALLLLGFGGLVAGLIAERKEAIEPAYATA